MSGRQALTFTAAGLPSLAVSTDTDSDTRKDALASLREGRVRALLMPADFFRAAKVATA